MIRIRPGRSWRHNPGYLGELRSLSPLRARGYSFGQILDVVGLEVDGVDIAAGVGEAPVLHTVDDLLQALLRLADGARAAQASVGPGPTEVVLEPRGGDVLLTLVTLRPPARVLAGGLLVDGARLRTAALQGARGLLGDLLDIAPALSQARLPRRLERSCALLARKRAPADAPWPSGGKDLAFVVRAARGRAACEIQVGEEAAARLACAHEVPHAPLAPLLGRGTLLLRLGEAPALSLEAPPYLVLRDLVREAGALVQAWEAGEAAYLLPLGPLELRCDLRRGEARAPGFSGSAGVPPVQLAGAVAGAAQSFAGRALRLARAHGSAQAAGQLEPLADLRAAALELLGRCRDLASGSLHRAPESVAPLGNAIQRDPAPPLARGKLRRLVYREDWRARAEPEARALFVHPAESGPVLVLRGDGLAQGRDLSAGTVLWQFATASGDPADSLAAAGSDIFISEAPEPGAGAALLRVDGRSGAVRWRRRMRGARPSLHACSLGVVRTLPDGSFARIGEDGVVAMRGKIAHGGARVLSAGERLLFCLPGGPVTCVSAADGRTLYQRRLGANPGRPLLVHDLLVVPFAGDGRSGARAVATWVESGEVAWEFALPGARSAPALCPMGEGVALLASDRVVALRARDGSRRFTARLPWEEGGILSAIPESDEQGATRRRGRGPSLLACGPGGATSCLDELGSCLWSLPAEGQEPARAPLLASGVALLFRGGGASLYDLGEGLLLARLGGESPAQAAAVAPDWTIALLDGDSGVAVHRLGLHLSVV